ncbi:MAG: cupin domain-containing protein [Candidatus Pacebacteria bacterium]|nr:cupin domain-containing protein [Candidatus Paceibacterota bacterium]MDD5356718.1 cupin domain-containing protein [Candidatus Paceibacterota bacterium]
MNTVAVPGCPGTVVEELPSALGRQFLRVTIERGGEVPLHSHECAATMIVTHGSARKLVERGNAERVKAGDVITKAAREPHGFTEIGEEGFSFISVSGGLGIVQEGGKLDMELV